MKTPFSEIRTSFGRSTERDEPSNIEEGGVEEDGVKNSDRRRKKQREKSMCGDKKVRAIDWDLELGKRNLCIGKIGRAHV